jgi:Xaa-Pro dipeptidase
MDTQRIEWIAEVMEREGYAALLCRLPQYVVLLTGYQPILGNTFCLATRTASGSVEFRIATPKDEQNRLPGELAVDVRSYAEETMESISTTLPAAREPLAALLRDAGLGAGSVIGYEGDRSPVATAYTQVSFPGEGTLALLRELTPGAELRDATDALDTLAARKTARELECIRRTEAVARQGFEAARSVIRAGTTEPAVVAAAYGAVIAAGYASPGASHVVAFVHVMAGARAADAYKAYNLTSNARLRRGDTVTVQMEVAVNGYYAELTRAFFVEEAADEWRKAHAACLAAHDAALRVIRDGVSGHEADAAARDVMRQRGFGEQFKHGLGHGFGFQAINHAAEPILHPASTSTLRAGMVHNMEPAVYIEGKGGIRLNDNVAVQRDGNELLSAALPRDLDWLVVGA